MSEPSPFRRLIRTLRGLSNREIPFTLTFEREDAVTLHARPGREKWTIHFLQNGEVEAIRFAPHGEKGDYKAVGDLLTGDAHHGQVDVSFGS